MADPDAEFEGVDVLEKYRILAGRLRKRRGLRPIVAAFARPESGRVRLERDLRGEIRGRGRPSAGFEPYRSGPEELSTLDRLADDRPMLFSPGRRR